MITLDNIETEIDKISELAHENNYQIEIDMEVGSCNGDPNIFIGINNHVCHCGPLSISQKFKANLTIPKDASCNFVWKLQGKTDQNTKVFQGQIIQDQYAKIKDIKINGLSLLKKNLYFYKHTKFMKDENNLILNEMDGLYFNGTLTLSIPTPIFPFLSKIHQERVPNELYRKTITPTQRLNLIKTIFD